MRVSGIPPLSTFVFDHGNPAALATLFTQEMLAKGFLASTGFYAIYAHQQNRNPFIDHPEWVACVLQATCSGAPAAPTGLVAELQGGGV